MSATLGVGVGQITVSFAGDASALAEIMERMAHVLRGGVYPLGMGHPAPQLDSVAVMDPAPLGRIVATPGALAQAVEDWAGDMRRRRKRDRSIEAFAGTVKAAMKSEGWSGLDALTFDAVTKYLGARVESGQWSGSTHDRHLSAFRSLTAYLEVSGKLERDPLAGARGIGDDEEQGSRAATTPEARALLEYAYSRQRVDRRATGNRGAVWSCLFMAGCRAGEPCGDESDAIPRGWAWGDMRLEESIPVIRWGPDSHKARRVCVLPLHPDLVAVLLEHRKTVPHAPTDPVFPIRATRAVFRADRERAGIEGVNLEGLRFSPHSARKWFRTALVEAGVQESLVGCLMRHQSGLAARYTQPSIEAMNQGLLSLPRIIPENNCAGFHTKTVESGADRTIELHAKLEESPQQHGSSGGRASDSQQASQPALAGSRPPRASCVGLKPGHANSPANESDPTSRTLMPTNGLHPSVDSIADWLEATARLLRSGCAFFPINHQEAQEDRTPRR